MIVIDQVQNETAPLTNRLIAGVIQPITVPLWLGAERRGVDLAAPLIDSGLRQRWHHYRYHDLLKRLEPTVNVPVPEPSNIDTRLHRRTLEFANEIGHSAEHLRDVLRSAIDRGALPVTIGGDHSLAIGSISGVAQATPRLGLLWFDTHADLNTPETSPTGHIHGMPLAIALGHGPTRLTQIMENQWMPIENICLLGIRDLDPEEQKFISDRDIWMLTMEEWIDTGLITGLIAALRHLQSHHVTGIHISFDLDVLDPVEFPGTGTPVAGGLTYRETAQLLRLLRIWDGPICSVDWVELNPLLDPIGHSTAIAISLLAKLLGESIR